MSEARALAHQVSFLSPGAELFVPDLINYHIITGGEAIKKFMKRRQDK